MYAVVEINLTSEGTSTMFSAFPIKYTLGTLKHTTFYLLIVSYFLLEYTFFVSENQYNIYSATLVVFYDVQSAVSSANRYANHDEINLLT